MINNPLSIIRKDHKVVEELFKEYEALGNGAIANKRRVVDQIIEELTAHSEMEETLCYPRFRDAFKNEDDKMVAEAYVEHTGAKKLMEDLGILEPDQPEFDASVQVLMEQVRHHVEEEENELLPAAEKEVPAAELEAMGDEMRIFKESRGTVV